ncbi:hypothetical protein DHD32_21145 [Arenibacter sp. TNZ]|uniref:hypothetical protein n=1 Tax=Arenibacter TaxID=178469 RepID=UPI000CD3ABDD|nr:MULTISPECIES: hypothetical protein [Arenibacter]MCM4173981.1 hypothetical protein [Arenibacter sp. TNZ]
MKKAFKTLLVLLTFGILSGFGTFDFISGVNKGNDRIEVSFNKKIHSGDLVKIKKSLSEIGITITYSSFDFDENGGLKSLSFNVDCNDGFKGGATKTDINNQTRWGFFRDYSEKAISPFGTGNLK